MENQEQKTFNEMTLDEQKKLAEEIAKQYVGLQKKIMYDMINDLFTPFYIKWYRKIKNKFSKK